MHIQYTKIIFLDAEQVNLCKTMLKVYFPKNINLKNGGEICMDVSDGQKDQNLTRTS